MKGDAGIAMSPRLRLYAPKLDLCGGQRDLEKPGHPVRAQRPRVHPEPHAAGLLSARRRQLMHEGSGADTVRCGRGHGCKGAGAGAGASCVLGRSPTTPARALGQRHGHCAPGGCCRTGGRGAGKGVAVPCVLGRADGLKQLIWGQHDPGFVREWARGGVGGVHPRHQAAARGRIEELVGSCVRLRRRPVPRQNTRCSWWGANEGMAVVVWRSWWA